MKQPKNLKTKKFFRSIKADIFKIIHDRHQPSELNSMQSEMFHACKGEYDDLCKRAGIGMIDLIRWLVSKEMKRDGFRSVPDHKLLTILMDSYITCNGYYPMPIPEKVEMIQTSIYNPTNIEFHSKEISEEDKVFRRFLVFYIERIKAIKTKKINKLTKKKVYLVKPNTKPKYRHHFVIDFDLKPFESKPKKENLPPVIY